MNSHFFADNFSQYFKIVFANSKQLRQEAFKIRYGVYSRELEWEPKNALKMETDKCDDYSFHCLVEHRRTEAFAGCIRLVIPPLENPSQLLPFEEHCLQSVSNETTNCETLVRGSFSEISRLAVLEGFRRNITPSHHLSSLEDNNPQLIYSKAERSNFPSIAIGLYLASIALAQLCNHRGVFVIMEPRLNRRLQRFGLPFK